ncbi:hypothetical protein NKR23_g2725 [Pleurostoma richardsiae]|uniref:Uncharacterized protein n=1 Tax=Pleurostoma richardsiae TaxID=41990 RepID=A0AA38VXV7_9PEZI|nr:hypothetical protein NKR23_g2725 [Pleurostoma richardsiae]
MTNSQYLQSGGRYPERMQVDTSLPRGACTSVPQPTVAYQAQQDLTPSSARQPKAMNSYHPSHAASSQQPTPPDTSRMYYPYDMHTASQASSPLTVQPQVTEGHYAVPSFIGQSPKDSVPPPMQPYYGMFGVSDTNEQDDTQLHGIPEYRSYIPSMDVDPGFMLQQQMPVSGSRALHRSIGASSHPPLLSQPNPSEFRPQRGLGIDNMRETSVLAARSAPSFAADTSPGHSRKAATKRRPASRRPSGKRAPMGPSLSSNGSAATKLDSLVEELQLRPDAKPDDKFVFELRKKYDGEKGKGMWCEIQKDYEKQFGQRVEREKLQMQVSRAVLKYAVWPKAEEEILLEAFQKANDEFSQRVLSFMKDMGGCKSWEWKPAHIELKLVQLGMLEPTIDEQSKVRRRKRAAARRRSNAQPQQAQQQLTEWQYHLGGAPLMRRPSMEDDMSAGPTFTPEQEDEIAEEIMRTRPFDLEDSPITASEESMDMDCSGNGPHIESKVAIKGLPQNNGRQQSKRVAILACEQMMHEQQVKREYSNRE